MTAAVRLRRPPEFFEGTRWLFAGLALIALLFTLLLSVRGGYRPLLLPAAAVLMASFTLGYLRRDVSPWLDVVDAAAILAFAAASPEPAMAYGMACAAQWYRSLYGSVRRAVLRFGLFATGLAGGTLLWTELPGHGDRPGLGLIGVVPTLLATVLVLVGPPLAETLRARERAVRLDALNVRVGSELLTSTDPDQIRAIAASAFVDICAIVPGLRMLAALAPEGGSARVLTSAGAFRRIPQSLPAGLLTTDGTGVALPALLDAATGASCAWAVVPLPGVATVDNGGLLLVGAPRRVPSEALASVNGVVNQVALAMRSSLVHQQLTFQATVDGLTGLANRVAFTDALSGALADPSAREVTVLFIDLDDFKQVNDVYGHQAGDTLLCEVANRLRRAVRPDDMCARLGGDEFAVLLRETGDRVAAEVAGGIVRSVGAPVQLLSAEATVGASIGVATAIGTHSGMDLEQLLHHADVAMYAAKLQGTTRIQLFEPSLLLSTRPDRRGRRHRQVQPTNEGGRSVVNECPEPLVRGLLARP